MYQLEVKRWLVQHRFQPAEGWKVRVDVDAMERGRGSQNKAEKAERARVAEEALVSMGATIGAHHAFGRADVVAEHPAHGLVLVEVEGDSSRQKEQAVYSALGQLLLQLDDPERVLALAVPDRADWEQQVSKIPDFCKERLRLSCFLVSERGVREL